MAPTPQPYLYADNAATTPLSPRALDAMMPYLTNAFGNPSGIHRIAREAAQALEKARSIVARALGTPNAHTVYFTSGGSESDNWVLRGAAQRWRDLYGAGAPVRIVTSAIEHHAVLHCCAALEREGVQVTYLPVDRHGFVRPEDLDAALTAHERAARAGGALGVGSNRGAERSDSDARNPKHAGAAGDGEGVGAAVAGDAGDVALKGNGCDSTHAPATALVSIMMANNEVGTIEPIQELAAVAHAHGVPFHTDAVQAVGHIPVDVEELGVDALSLSAHKFHGPRGVGALYLREGFSIPPLIAGGAQERGERAGTENVAGVIGMAAALEESCAHLERDMERVAALRDELIHHVLSAVDGVRLTGAPCAGTTCSAPNPGVLTSAAATVDFKLIEPARLPSIASFTCENVDGELLVVLLDRAGVAAATGSACSTGSTEPSHVLTAMGVNAATARGALRLSLANDITREELDLLKQRVPACIRRARIMSGLN